MIFNGNRIGSFFPKTYRYTLFSVPFEVSLMMSFWWGKFTIVWKQVMYENIMMLNEKRFGSRNCAKFTYKYNFVHIRYLTPRCRHRDLRFVVREKSKYWKIIFMLFFAPLGDNLCWFLSSSDVCVSVWREKELRM